MNPLSYRKIQHQNHYLGSLKKKKKGQKKNLREYIK